jgi:hypothetical protein
MTENKPKIEGKPRFPPSSGRNAGPYKKEFIAKVVGLVENHTFDIGT